MLVHIYLIRNVNHLHIAHKSHTQSTHNKSKDKLQQTKEQAKGKY